MNSLGNSRLIETLRMAIQLEAAALLDFSESLPDSMHHAIELVNGQSSTRLVCTGMGKSGHIASKVCATLVSTGTPSQFLHPAEALHGDLGMVLPNDIILAFSNSGETEEIVRLLPFFRDNIIPVISIVGNSNSTLAKYSNVCISYSIEREACPHNLAPTSSTTLSLAIGDALAIGLMEDRNFTPIDFARFHPGGSLGKKLLGRVADYLAPCPTIRPEELIVNAAKTIIANKALIGAVVDQQRVIGAITLGDIVRALTSNRADQCEFIDKIASSCMSKDPILVSSSTVCSEAESLMSESEVNSLIVVDETGLPVGSYNLSSTA
jgi:arabinose-5-phosphate isomerase